MRRLLGRLLVLVLVGVAGVAIGGQPALAHGQLVRTVPTAGSTISEPVTTVKLYFSQKPTSNAFFSVTSPGGTRVDKLWSHGTTVPLSPVVWEWFHNGSSYEARSYETGYEVLLPVAFWPEPGDYVVKYTSVASDNQLVQGEFTITYDGPVAAAPKDYKPQRAEPDPNLVAVARSDQPAAPPAGRGGGGTSGPDAEEDAGNSILLWLVLPLLVAAILAGIFFFRLMRGPARPVVPMLSPLERRLARERAARAAAPISPASPPALPARAPVSPASPPSSAPTSPAAPPPVPPPPPPIATDAT